MPCANAAVGEALDKAALNKATPNQPTLKRLTLMVAAYLALYTLFQAAYQALRTGGHSHWLIDQLTVAPSAALIGSVFPGDGVWAQGSRVMWPGGSLALLAGCDGFEVLALYLPAVLVSPVSWRRGLAMLVLGSALIWLFNQGRLLTLYAAFRYWHDGFDALHTVWAPLLMLAMVCAFFVWNLRRAP